MSATPASGRNILRSPWLRLTMIIIVVGAWAWFLRRQIGALQEYPWAFDAGALTFGIGWGALYFGGLALSWTLLLRTMGGAAREVPLIAGASLWLNTMLTRYIPGNVWHIVGRIAFARDLGVSRTQVLTSATIEQGLTIMGALAVVGLTLPFWGERSDSPLWLLILIPLGLIAIHPAVMGRMLGWAALRLRRPDLAWSYSYGEMIAVIGAYTLANLAAGIALYAVLAGLSAIPLTALPELAGMATLAWVAGYLSLLTPSGLGVREAALTALLAQIVPLPVAIAGSLVHRLALTIGEVVAVGGAWIYRSVTNHLRNA
jgi:hypothetical protein